ncbi:MAG: Pterin-4-alpha-carbinolamine dehydratase, partial [Mycobacterium sp.]|nr:Pterin-4-alpha-carbinolamine dehydratase [Mycobacterium sp.]
RTRDDIAEATEPLGWRILGVLVTHVPVASPAAAADVARTAIDVAAADAAGHLSIDLHADRVVLRLHTLAAAAVTARDIELAQQLSATLPTRPGDETAVPQTIEIAIDALDIAAVRPF